MKVFVGLSGGVDSSVSAALLKQAGHDVVGVFLRVWQPDFLPCSWREERTDAKRVCATLGIPFLELDCSEEYKKNVADYMIREYNEGRTPNPDVMCNAHIKFGVFYEKALALGADFVATGHYARVEKTDKGTTQLLTGVDQEKDQSYFLWQLPQEKIARVLFPIGDKQKSDVRALAQEFNLHTAAKKDSQGLCFLGKLDMHDFLKHFIEEKTGDLLNEQGEIIGTHNGVVFLTLGQRHGFTVTKKTPHDTPYYVIKKDVEKNTVTVTQEPLTHTSRETNVIRISQTNWVEQVPEQDKTYSARLRYRQALFSVMIKIFPNNTAEVTALSPQPFVPSGQSLVLYDGEVCLGGGVIE